MRENPNGDEVLQVAILCTKDLLDSLTEETGGQPDSARVGVDYYTLRLIRSAALGAVKLAEIVKNLSLDVGVTEP